MANVALGKGVLEKVTYGIAVTDGNASKYTVSKGFAFFYWPSTLTVDLGDLYQLHCIRFLLWDGLGESHRARNMRRYKYRLLVSDDSHSWRVLFTTVDDGSSGWQEFLFNETVSLRYIRIHGLWNSANREFHIVQLEAHNDTPPPLDSEYMLRRTLSNQPTEIEQGDGYPISSKVVEIADDIQRIVDSNNVLNPDLFSDLLKELRLQVSDVSAVESSMESIRREILSPVLSRLKKAEKLGRFSYWGFIVGLVGGLLAIATLLINLVI